MNITKILVLGKTGEGKSTLCNYILKYEEKKCKESNQPGSCTKTVDGFISNYYKDIFMIDTPGLSDSSGEDEMIVDRIRNAIKNNHGQGIKSIILVSNVTVDRLSFEDKRLLMIYCKMFPVPDFWYHVGIIFSKSFEYFPDIVLNNMKLAKQKDFLKDLIETIKHHTNELNKNLPQEKKLQIPGVIQSFFTDCGEVIQGFNHDRTDKEINRLINWARGNKYIDFSGNDFNTEININYKSIERGKDRKIINNKKVKENETKRTVEYYKSYNVIDYYDKKNEIFDKKPYKIEIKYIIKVEWDEEESKEETKDGNKIVNKKKITYEREDIYDENRKLIEKGKAEEKTSKSFSFTKEYKMKYPKYHVNYDTKTIYKGSISEVHAYFEALKESPVPAKILWGISNIHPVVLVANLVMYIVSKIKKPERWRIIERYYRDEIWEKVTHYKDNNEIDYIEPDRLIDTKNPTMESEEPVRID